MKYYLIGEIAEKLGINKETIRYYEKINLIKYDLKKDNSYHYYSENTFLRLKFILEIKKYGFTLNEIKVIISLIMKGLNKEEINSVIDLLHGKLEYLDSAIKKINNIKVIIKKLIDDIKKENLGECNQEECGVNEIKEILDFLEKQ